MSGLQDIYVIIGVLPAKKLYNKKNDIMELVAIYLQLQLVCL